MTDKKSPSERLEEIGIETICEYIANGNSLRQWCIENDFVQMTVNNWIYADEERTLHYARGKEDRELFYFDRFDDYAKQAIEAPDAVAVAGLRLATDIDKWKLARMNPKKYGNKIAIGGAPDLGSIKVEAGMNAFYNDLKADDSNK